MIFISYRHSDAGGHAGRLFDRLKFWFDADEIFFDVETMEAGEVFPERIERAVSMASVVLVVIGPEWLSTLNERATDTKVDFVRQEVTTAIKRRRQGKAVVIPVLVGETSIPSIGTLYPGLRDDVGPLFNYQAHTFTPTDWDHQFVQLRKLIAKVSGITSLQYRPPVGTVQPYSVIEDLLSYHFWDPNGRLQALHESIEHRSNVGTVACSVLHGMGGIGKTQLALKFTLDYRDRYAGVWWFRADGEHTLQHDALECCKEVGVSVPKGHHPGQALKRWLERREQRWLLVFDNVHTSDRLLPYLPRAGNHHVILTSRNPELSGVADLLKLDTWAIEQGVQFLMKRLPDAERQELSALVTLLDGLPLAIEQAARYIENTGANVRKYRMLVEHNREVLDADEGRPATGYSASVTATLLVAYQKLSSDARLLLRLCSFAAPEPLPEWVFDADDSLPERLSETVMNERAWDRTVGELRSYGFLDRVQDTSGGQNGQALILHRLTQRAIREKISESGDDFEALQRLLYAGFPEDPINPQCWPRCAALAEHAIQLDRFPAAGHCDPTILVRLWNRVGVFLLRGYGLYKEASCLLEKASLIARKALGEKNPDTLASRNHLAEALLAQGDIPGARALHEQVLEARKSVLGEEHPDTLRGANDLAETLWAQGDVNGAQQLLEKLVKVSRRVFGVRHPDTLEITDNLAATRWARGDPVGARELREDVLNALRQERGEEHPDTLACMNNLAETLLSQGDIAGARALHEHVLAVRRRKLGKEHPDTLASKNNLALTLQAQGDIAGARALHEDVLEASRRVLGEEHPHTLKSKNNLALTLRAQGDIASARALHEDVLEASRRLLGERHPDTLLSMSNLAETLEAQGDIEGARALHEEVRKVR